MKWLLVVALFVCVSFIWAGEIGIKGTQSNVDKKDLKTTSSNVNIDKERSDRLERICQELEAKGPIKPVDPRGPHIVLAKAIVWCVDNAVRPDGWQLTGWSKIKLDEEFRVSRFKIGIINPEIEATRIDNYEFDAHKNEDFERWRASKQGIVFGIFWSKEF